MKKIILLALCMTSILMTEAKKVQFQVDMTGQTISSFGVHVIGDFQTFAGYPTDFDPSSCLMTPSANNTNIYQFTVDIPAYKKYEFRYVNGDQTYESEVIPLESQVGTVNGIDIDNRWIYFDSLGTDTLRMPPVLFSQNAPAGEKLIRYRVDMELHAITSGNGVTAISSHIGVSNPSYRMCNIDKKVYEIIGYSYDSAIVYRFSDGYAAPETVPTACANGIGARTHNLTSDTVLPIVCFSSCSTCYPASVNNLAIENQVLVYPNPSSGSFKITFKGNDSYNVTVTSLTGNIVFEKKEINDTIIINNSNWSQGMYFLQAKDSKGTVQTQKVIIE